MEDNPRNKNKVQCKNCSFLVFEPSISGKRSWSKPLNQAYCSYYLRRGKRIDGAAPHLPRKCKYYALIKCISTEEKIMLYWRNKTPEVRAAVEEYIEQMKRFGITEYPFNFDVFEWREGWHSQSDIAKKHYVTTATVNSNIRKIFSVKEYKEWYFAHNGGFV